MSAANKPERMKLLTAFPKLGGGNRPSFPNALGDVFHGHLDGLPAPTKIASERLVWLIFYPRMNAQRILGFVCHVAASLHQSLLAPSFEVTFETKPPPLGGDSDLGALDLTLILYRRRLRRPLRAVSVR